MKEKKRDETRRSYDFIRILGIGVLALIMLVSIAGAEPSAYITNSEDSTVSMTDAATNTATDTVDAGNPSCEVAVTPSKTQITRITTTKSASDPHIYGDRIVYQDSRNGKSNIYMYNISTKKETKISKSGTAKYPAIYGNRIVWKDDRNGKSDIYMYDISTSQESKISANGTAYSRDEFSGPEIYNDRIVWQEPIIDDTYGLFVYDISTKQKSQVAEETSTYYYSFISFAIHSDKIVYYYLPISSLDFHFVSMYDLSTKQTTDILRGVTPSSPDIYGDRIVLEELSDDDNGSYYFSNISMYNLSTQQKIQVSTSGKAYNPAIYGDRIVWKDYRKWEGEFERYHYPIYMYNPDIYMYNLSSSKETQITTSGSPNSPDIYGDRIVWADGDLFGGNSSDIYMCTVPGSEPVVPVANFSASPTVGKAPLTVTFTDQSTGSPACWYWKFGDKCVSTDQNPVHTYKKAGKYTVSLTVENEAGKDTKKICKYIIVKK